MLIVCVECKKRIWFWQSRLPKINDYDEEYHMSCAEKSAVWVDDT